jgi:hypothetical protein
MILYLFSSFFFLSKASDNTGKKPKLSEASLHITASATTHQTEENTASPTPSNRQQHPNDVNRASPTKNGSPPVGLSLTPEQKSQIEAKQNAARAKLQEKTITNGPDSIVKDIGASWHKALSAEFTKPYFKEVTC